MSQCIARNPDAGGRCQREATENQRCAEHWGWVDWEATPPEMLRLSDGADVPHAIGTAIYNYYDMEPGFITALATRPQKDTSGMLPDGIAWWVDTSAGYLDGSRMCSIEFAQKKGWLS
jgi:hypothetical protein